MPAERSKHRRDVLLDRLEIANAKRSAISEMKEDMKSGKIDPLDLIEGTLDETYEKLIERIPLRRLLPMMPGIGQSRMIEALIELDVSPSITMPRLTYARRKQLRQIVADLTNRV